MAIHTIQEGTPQTVYPPAPQRALVEASKTNTAGTQATASRANVDKQAQAAPATENTAHQQQGNPQNSESHSGGNSGTRINLYA